jgi:prepilin-type N-terminal cleavage/methylation domain-containing protein
MIRLSQKKKRAFSLIEMLVCILIIAILASFMLPATVKAYRRSKAWIWGVYAFNENRINAFIDGNPKWEMFYATNKPSPWTFIEYRKDGSMVMY